MKSHGSDHVAARGAPHHSPLGRSPPIEVSWSWENGASRIAVTLRAASLLGRPTTDSLGALFFGRERLPAHEQGAVRSETIVRHDHGRRHARHSHSAVGDAGRPHQAIERSGVRRARSARATSPTWFSSRPHAMAVWHLLGDRQGGRPAVGLRRCGRHFLVRLP
jgi:hypothetical protein